jgi:hypothetical protein
MIGAAPGLGRYLVGGRQGMPVMGQGRRLEDVEESRARLRRRGAPATGGARGPKVGALRSLARRI